MNFHPVEIQHPGDERQTFRGSRRVPWGTLIMTHNLSSKFYKTCTQAEIASDDALFLELFYI
jgi:hypothetical protein